MDTKDFKTLIIDDTVYKTQYTNKYKNRIVWTTKVVEEIKTVIPGTVVKLNVKVGDEIALGDTLCLFEAMKMENVMCSPHAGIVRAINVKEGDKLPKGFVLMLVEEK